jgi:hypothetical protein
VVPEDETDIIFIQEPCTIQSKGVGISTKYKTFTLGGGRCTAAVVVTNSHKDAMLIQQVSDEYTVAVEIIKGSIKLVAVSMYFDRENQIQEDLGKMESIMHHTKDTGVLFASNSNARSTLWHDTLTNTRGGILEAFIMSQQLYIMNEESSYTTFRNCLGTSNTDLTIISSQLLNSLSGWVISDQESISDHSIIKYAINPSITKWHTENAPHTRYKTNTESLAKFQGNILRILRNKFGINHNVTHDEDLDDTLCSLLTGEADIEKRIDEFNEALIMACNISFQIHRTSRSAPSHRTVPWCSADLTVLEKEQMPYTDYAKEPGTMTNSGRSEKHNTSNVSKKHNTSNVKQHTQPPSKGKKLDPGENTAT